MTTLVLPFSIWTLQGPEADLLARAELPHWRAWLTQAQRTQVLPDAMPAPGRLAAFTPPHERLLAQAQGWVQSDGCFPWAARAAAAAGHDGHAAWAFISLCHWQVSNGQVTLGDPDDLQIDPASNQALFDAMHGFFAEDGIALHPYRNGVWLAQSPLFANLQTASLDRVIGRNIDPWLVDHPVLRRLQNEMQMLLYTHAVNEGRSLSINSFWLHGAGALPPTLSAPPVAEIAPSMAEIAPPCQVPDVASLKAMRCAALQNDLYAWLHAWQALDAELMQPLLHASERPTHWVLCGDQVAHVYRVAAPSMWQRMQQLFQPISLSQVIGVSP